MYFSKVFVPAEIDSDHFKYNNNYDQQKQMVMTNTIILIYSNTYYRNN